LKQRKTWFDEDCSGYLDQTKQAKMQWVQEPKQNNAGNLNNVRREAGGHFRKLKKEYIKIKLKNLKLTAK